MDDDGWENNNDPSPRLADPPHIQWLHQNFVPEYRDPFYALVTSDGEYSDVERAFLERLNSSDLRLQGHAIQSINRKGNITWTDVHTLRWVSNSSEEVRNRFERIGFDDEDNDSIPNIVEMYIRFYPGDNDPDISAAWSNLTSDRNFSEYDQKYFFRIRGYASPYFKYQVDERYYIRNVTKDGQVTAEEWSQIEDQDNDLLLDKTERQIGTSTESKDTDSDGFTDVIEHFGMNTSDPLTPDVYIEVDTTTDGHFLEKTEETLITVYRDADSPVTPIRLHFMRNETDLPPRETWYMGTLNEYNEKYHQTRGCGYHYLLVVGAKTIKSGSREVSGFASTGRGLYRNPWDESSAPDGQWMVSVGPASHELGHMFGLNSYAHDNEVPADVYPSTMNYNYDVYVSGDGYAEFKGINSVYSNGSDRPGDRDDWARMKQSKFNSHRIFQTTLENYPNNCPN